MEERPLGGSGVSITRVILGCGNFGGIGSSPAFFGQGTSKDDAFRLHGHRLGRGDHDLRHRRRLRRRPQRDLHRRVARDEGRRRPRPDRDRDEDVQPDGRRRRPRSRPGPDPPPDRVEPANASGSSRVGLYLAHDFDPDTPQEETLQAFDDLVAVGQGRRGRRLELQRRATRGGARALGARRAASLRVGAERLLAPRSGRSRRRVFPSAASTGSATRRSARSPAAG